MGEVSVESLRGNVVTHKNISNYSCHSWGVSFNSSSGSLMHIPFCNVYSIAYKAN